MNRRLFLRGLGGAAVAAPFLSSVAERAAKAQGAPPPGDPKRLIVMFTHYGCLTTRWFPVKSHGTLAAGDYAGTALEVLAPHAAKLLMPRGVRAMNEWTSNAKRGQGNDPHLQVVGSYFTCVPVTPHTDDPFSFVAATKFEAMPTAPSLDHVCARQLNRDGGPPLYLRVSGNQDAPPHGISYSAGEQLFQGFGTPLDAFSSLTGLFENGTPTTPDDYLAVRGKSIIDVVRQDLETLERADMSAADKSKLDAWKQLLSETGGQVAGVHCTGASATRLGLTETNVGVFASQAEITETVADGLDRADLYSNLAVLAALCDQSRVIFLNYPGDYSYKGLGINVASHMLSHRLADATGGCLPNANELIHTLDKYYASKFAHLVRQLDGFEEGGGTLLDNTATVWFQEMSDGNAHNLNNLPIIQAGSCGGYFKVGQAVNVDDGAADLTRGNSEVACDPGGQISTGSGTGTPPELANAPINKYFCNLMNAIGVKAGPDGFPAPGGAAEVTHYGMYDDTTDFASGGVNPPKINSPGGFEALKANS